jgi:hypothetical protein
MQKILTKLDFFILIKYQTIHRSPSSRPLISIKTILIQIHTRASICIRIPKSQTLLDLPSLSTLNQLKHRRLDKMCEYEEFSYVCGHKTDRIATYCHFARNDDPLHQCKLYISTFHWAAITKSRL